MYLQNTHVLALCQHSRHKPQSGVGYVQEDLTDQGEMKHFASQHKKCGVIDSATSIPRGRISTAQAGREREAVRVAFCRRDLG